MIIIIYSLGFVIAYFLSLYCSYIIEKKIIVADTIIAFLPALLSWSYIIVASGIILHKKGVFHKVILEKEENK